jgi:autotransporter-associated beta strand protein
LGLTWGGANSLNLGAISIDNTRTTALNIGNSSGAAGVLRLYGATVNSINNVVVRNNGTGLFTLQAAQNGTMGVVLSNATNNIINIDNTGGITISAIISGGSNVLTKSGTGAGVLELTAQNTYTGLTTVSGGTLRLNRTGGTTLPVGNSVTVNSGATLLISTAQQLANVTVDAGGTLIVAANLTITGTAAINGTFQINQGGFASGGTWTYGSGATLIYNNTSGIYGPIDAGHTYWPSSSGPTNVTVQGAGGINLGVSRTVTGIFQTAAGVTLSSGAALTCNDICRINTGGFFNQAPTYGAASTLVYNTASVVGSPFGRGNEWSATSGAGYPNNVTLTGNTFVDLGNGGTGTLRRCAGALQIDSGSGLFMDFSTNDMTQPLVVLGNVNQQGALSLSDVSGGDLKVGGNCTRGGGTFSPKGRAVFFDAASGDQTINGSATTFDFLIVDKAAGSLNLNSNVTCNQTLTLTNGIINTGANVISVAATGSVVRTNGWVNGNLRRFVPNTSNPSIAMAIGDATNYTPVTIDFTGTTSGSGALTASTTATAPPAGALPTGAQLDAAQYVNRRWVVTNSGVGGFTSYSPTFTFVSGDIQGGANPSNFVVRKLDGGNWASTTTGVTSATTTQSTGLTSFSEFAIGIPCVGASALSYTTSPATYCINTAITNNTPTVTGDAPIMYSVSPSLPAGLSLDMGTGIISGTPTATATAADYTVTATNSCGSTTAVLTITVNAEGIASSAPTLCINTALTPITHIVTGNISFGGATGFPAGVTGSFFNNTFTIFGIPTESGTFI